MAKAVSIVILCHGQWERTRTCLESLRRSTPSWLYEVLAFDNASPDRTHARLLRLARSWPQLRVFKNGRNLTFAEGVNRATAAASGRHIVWLNNDTVVSPGWLEGLLATARSDDAIAAVGPMTDFMAPPEQISAAFPVERFVRAEEARFLGGFCFLLKRRAAESIGRLDERFVWGWEDIDYCLRLRQAGWRLALARHVFVAHAGSVTLKGMPLRRRRATDMINRRLLSTKWLASEEAAQDLAELFDKSPAPWDDQRHPRWSVVVLCKGDWAKAGACLRMLRRRAPREAYEVLAADLSRGGRCLPKLEALARDWPELRVLGRWDGAPYADAANRALGRALGRYFVLLSDDAAVPAGWLEGLTAAAGSRSNVGMVAARAAGAGPPSKGVSPAASLRGPCLLLPRRSLALVGGLDDRFPGEGAQTDLSLRLFQAGYQLLTAGGVTVKRLGARRRSRESPEDARLLFQKWAGRPHFLPKVRR